MKSGELNTHTSFFRSSSSSSFYVLFTSFTCESSRETEAFSNQIGLDVGAGDAGETNSKGDNLPYSPWEVKTRQDRERKTADPRI